MKHNCAEWYVLTCGCFCAFQITMASLWRASSSLLSRLGGKQALVTGARCVSTTKDKKDIIDANVTTGPIQEPHRVTLSPEAKQKLRGEVKTDVSKICFILKKILSDPCTQVLHRKN